ncbi:MAG: CsgG/HfaB family protein [Phycisphaerae bacterium]|nr:CsgG/HfaB family protein [Tepidisphaeraceae bacterium]
MKIASIAKSVLALAVGAGTLAGCSTKVEETAGRDTLTRNVGVYPPAPAGAARPKVGVPPFDVKAANGFSGGSDLNALAADQMTTLLEQSERFRVIERAQLKKLLDEQNLEGIVKPGELAKSGNVRGVDYLLIGKVTNLRVKTENLDKGFGLGQVGGLVQLGGAAVKNTETRITTEAGVDIRLVDPTTGEVMASHFSEYKKTDSASAQGITILGAHANAGANIQVSEDDKGKILRLALDDVLRKTLPKIDRFLASNENKANAAARNTPPATPATPVAPASTTERPATPQAAAAKKFCGECGKEVAAGVKFCPSCGGKVGQ